MEKTLKRQIGFKKPKETAKVVKPSKAVLPKQNGFPVKEVELYSKEKKIVAWINSHPFFAWGRMCRALGLHAANFQRTMQSEKPYIKLENIVKIEEALKPYGYE